MKNSEVFYTKTKQVVVGTKKDDSRVISCQEVYISSIHPETKQAVSCMMALPFSFRFEQTHER
jgi:hypothetical protein